MPTDAVTLSQTFDPLLPGAIWLAAEDAAARASREAGWHWAWGAPATDERARQFVWIFRLAEGLCDAQLLIGAQKGLEGVWLDGRALHAGEDLLVGRELAVLPLGDLAAGEHRLAVSVRLFHPFIKGDLDGALAARLSACTADGGVLHLAPAAAQWRTRTEAPDGWQQPGAALGEGWHDAQAPEHDMQWAPMPPQPARLLRRGFTLVARPVAATLTITALGAYEAEINGQRVGDAWLAPECTDFRHRLLVQRHDVCALLQPGANALGVMVGDGWYASEMLGRGRYPFGEAPRRLAAQLDLVFADGSCQQVVSDGQWRASDAPVSFSEIYHGETHDARREQAGWSRPGFDDRGWDSVWAVPPPPAALALQESPPIRATMTLAPIAITPLAGGDWLVDFGQNFAGVCRITVRGEAGRTVTMRFAEVLGAGGEVDMSNLRGARCTDRYILRGDAQGETWQPRFTYHGFRYLQVSGWPGELRAADVEAVVLHSDLAVTGRFESQQPVLQGLWRNTFWSQRSNFVGLPTDCPQRNERLGWTGDAQIFWPTAAFNMDVRGFTRRFLADLRASQRADGAYYDTNPPALPAYGVPGWSDAGVVLPHTVWQHYGDTAIIDEHWASMTRWMRYIAEANPDGLWRERRGVDFGDWLALDAKGPGDPTTPKLLVGTACWARMLGQMAAMAAATGREAEARAYAEQHARVAAAFVAEFLHADDTVGNGSHTSFILALAFGLVPQARRTAVAAQLAQAIRARGTLLTTGFLGTPFALDALADHGQAALAVALLVRTEFPGWGYMVSRGATTIWERWNSDASDQAMNSFNHYALGAATAFLYRRVAGIDAAAPGFARLRVAPLLDPRLGAGSCRVDTVQGAVETAWAHEDDGRARFSLVVPPGVRAQVFWPDGDTLEVGAGTHDWHRPVP